MLKSTLIKDADGTPGYRHAELLYDMCNPAHDPEHHEAILILHFRHLSLPLIFPHHHGHAQVELTPPDYGGNQLVRKWGWPEGSIK
jgi:hypothetical protein